MLAALLELAPAGVEQVDGDGWVEYALYGAPGELPTLPEGRPRWPARCVEVRGEDVPDDWDERWKRFHVPLLIGGRLYVRPPWEEPAVRPGVHEVVIDPGQAFGTGTHPTTRLCLELLLELEPRGLAGRPRLRLGRARDRGGKLGFGPVAALDADRAAVAATDSERARQRRGARPRRALRPAPQAPPPADVGGRQPHAPAAAARGGADDGAAALADPLRAARRRRPTRSRPRSRRWRSGGG